MERDDYLARWADLHGGFDPRGSRLVLGWLTAVHALARPLSAARVSPDAVTGSTLAVGGLAVAAAAPHGRWPVAAAVLVGVAGGLDSLDGALAVLTGRATRWGFVLDSVVDRLVDGLLLVALWRLGAPGGWVVGAGAALALLEYVRARAGNAGMGEIGVVTVGERPTRMALAAGGLLTAGVLPAHAAAAATTAAVATAAVSALGCGQLLVVVRRRLR